jgi:hypothetical protein
MTFLKENRAVYEIMWRNMVEPDRPRMTNMAYVHRMLDTEGYKHTLRICNTYCFPLLQLSHERSQILRCAFSTCLVTRLTWR